MLSKNRKGLTLLVELGTDQARYLCAQPSRDRSQPGRLVVNGYGLQESSRSLEELVKHLATRKLKPKHLVLLLPRAEFEVNLFQLPEVDENEVPQVVRNLVTESVDSIDCTTDFLLHARGETEGSQAMAWTLANSVLDDLRNEARRCGLNLAGVTSRSVGSIALWRNLVQSKSPHAVIVTIAQGSIDFAVIYRRQITHIRSIPFPKEDLERVTARLISELHRTVAVTGDDTESDATRIYLFGSAEERKSIAEALTEEFEVPVSILNPVDNTEFADQPLNSADSEEYAHLLGAAKAHFFDKLDIDLIAPREPEKKTLPWRRIATWAFVVLSLAGLGGFVLWDEAQQQQAEIAEKREQFDQLAPQARRVIEMRDELAAIRAWRSNEVVWLDQLDALSRALPERKKSLIRRVSMGVADDGVARIDLAVEVADNSLVVGLEQAIRTDQNQVVSKRVSESTGPAGERWNFETSIRFEVTPPKLSFIEDESGQKPASETEPPESVKPEPTSESATEPDNPAESVEPDSPAEPKDQGQNANDDQEKAVKDDEAATEGAGS